MLWMHYLVDDRHFAKYGTNRMKNANKRPKIPYCAMVKKWKGDLECTSRSGSPPKVDHF